MNRADTKIVYPVVLLGKTALPAELQIIGELVASKHEKPVERQRWGPCIATVACGGTVEFSFKSLSNSAVYFGFNQ